MAPLFVHNVHVAATTQYVGVFGCTLTTPLDPAILMETVQQIATKHQATFQLVNAEYVASRQHLLFAAIHALTAHHRGTQRASTLAMEILRFTAAQRQISVALDQLGITKTTKRLGGVLISSNKDALENAFQDLLQAANAQDTPEALAITDTTKLQAVLQTFQIGPQEVDAISNSTSFEDRSSTVEKLVYDRCALLAISR